MTEIDDKSDPFNEALGSLLEKSRSPEAKQEYEEYEAMLRETKISQLFLRSGIPRLFKDKDFNSFTGTKENLEALKGCIDFVNDWQSGCKGIGILGNIGTGKSHLACAIVHELILKGVTARYANVLHVFELARQSFDGVITNPIPRLMSAEFLVLDDFGSVRPTTWTLEQLFHIVEYRLSECLTTMITSNARDWYGIISMLSIERAEDTAERVNLNLMVGRIVDRLRCSIGDVYTIKGKSWR